MKNVEIVCIELTNACNTKCNFCPREKMKRPLGFMKMDLFKKIIDECAKYNIQEINLTGYGESFLDPDLIKKIKYVKTKFNPILVITTNCSLLNSKINKQLINSGLDEIKASIYSLDDMEYKEDQKFELNNILSNLKDLKIKKREALTKLPYVIICFTEGLHDKKIPEYKRKIRPYIDQIEPEMGLHNFLYGRNYNKVKKTNKRLPCNRPSNTMIIRWDGKVVACCFDFDSVMTLGDVSKNTLQEVINSNKYKNFCNKLKKRKYNELPYCNICDQPEPYTLINRLKKIYYLNLKRPFQRKKRINFYKKLRWKERVKRRVV